MEGKNIYTVSLSKSVKIDKYAPAFGSAETTCLYVIASGFAEAVAACKKKYPEVDGSIRGVSLINYLHVPIVVGD